MTRSGDGTNSAAYADIRNDVGGDGGAGLSAHNRNLSAWRVSVPRAYHRPEIPGSSRITAVMVIIVQRIDIHEEGEQLSFK